ncbi:MAG: TRAP transporter small permease [Burkholderiaceae bacterium]|nr:TRAP transporter small permease [Burkholderiaceae bacterium]
MQGEPERHESFRPQAAVPLGGRWLGPVDRIAGRVFRWVNVLGVCMIIVMMLLTSVDVTLRYCCSRPITGAVELVEFLLVIAVFFGLAHTQRMGGNIAADIIDTLVSRRALAVIDVFTGALALVLCIAMTWATYEAAMDPNAHWETTDMLEVPIWPFKLLAAVGMGLLSLEMALNLVRKLLAMAGRGSEDR